MLPFASRTGSACKSVILDFVDSEERADALSAIALVEKIGGCSLRHVKKVVADQTH